MNRERDKPFLADKIPEIRLLYRAIFEQSPDGILIIDTQGNFLEFNEAAHCQLGYSREEFAKLAIKDIDPVESPEQIQASIEHVLKTGWSDFEVKHRTKAGEIRDVQVIVKVIDLAGRKILQCIWRDITERKRAEEALRRSKGELEATVGMRTAELVRANRALDLELKERKSAEESLRQSEGKYKNLVELTTDIIYLTDRNGNRLFMNDAGYKILGYSAEELIGKPFINVIHPDDREKTLEKFHEMIEKGVDAFDFENRYMTKTGKAISVLHNIRLLRNAMGEVLGTQGIARDITERKAFEEKLKLYLEAIEAANNGIQIVDLDGKIIYSNKAVERIYGFSPDEFAGKHVNEMNADKTFAERIILPSIAQSGNWDGEIMVNHKNGSVFHVWLAASMIKDDTGKPIAMVGIIRDITELKKSQAIIKASLREKEILLREIYHRTKNNMQVIMSLIKLQLASVVDDGTRQMFKDTQDRIMSMAIVHEKLYKSKDLSNVSLRDYINDLTSSLLESYNMSGKISPTINVEEILLSIDSITPLGLIINELMTNSLKYAFPGGGKGEIRIEGHLAGNDEIEIRFADNGMGFPKGLDFKNKKSLGLRLVHNLAEIQLGGKVELRANKGTEFVIRFKNVTLNKKL